MSIIKPWTFLSADGSFRLEDPQKTSYLYFPLVNEAGLMSVVTPSLHGDAKADQHSFLLAPVSVEDLHTSRAARNFWVHNGHEAWSATGTSAAQTADPNGDQVTLEAGLLWHTVTRRSERLGLQAEVTSYVPPTPDRVELMQVTLTNLQKQAQTITPTAAIPLYGRSADNLRDHRNVTSMLHRTRCAQHGVLVRPVLSFDERGHHANTTAYAVLGAEGDGTAPLGFFPAVEDFIGEGGTLDWPAAVVNGSRACQPAGATLDGYETIGALRFADVTLQPGESRSYVLILAILSGADAQAPAAGEPDWGENQLIAEYGTAEKFAAGFRQNQEVWLNRVSTLSVKSGEEQFDRWLKWVTVQPVLRRLYGCSFMPYHDYGRGGRGWRDLWQDILALMLMENGPVDHLLYSNFAGVRLDGSNATIIGSQPGEFKADRNNIPRVWMDHGLWPLTTTKLYIDQSGDLNFLLRQSAYFKDSHTHRCQSTDLEWEAGQGTVQHDQSGQVTQGSILEHFLIQHLTAFFHAGQHNNIQLEGADWNDGMDMARQRGESVAFSAFYASNLTQLSELVLDLAKNGVKEVELLEELLPLLDTVNQPVENNQPVDYSSPQAKLARLNEYFDSVKHAVSGKKAWVAALDLAADLKAKADWMVAHLRANEWIQNKAGYGWFNGYYNNDGAQLEGDHPLGTRMTLSGQVFTLMGGIASDEQAREMLRSADHYLFDEKVGGYRLNTDMGEMLFNMGRCFGYAFGHKENGAMFSHMAVMFAYALYERGFAHAGFKTLNTIYRQAVNFETSRMYPGLPEYFSERGRGMYPYLTGSASWYLLAFVTKAFGVRGTKGDLTLAPMLVREQFDASGEAAISTLFAGQQLEVAYHNPQRLDYGDYQIRSVRIDGQPVECEPAKQALLARSLIAGLSAGQPHRIDVELG